MTKSQRHMNSSRARAFTMIEMLLACVLFTLLTVGVLSVLSHLSRDQQVLSSRNQNETQILGERLVNVLRLDLLRGSQAATDHAGNVLIIDGVGEMDPLDHRPRNRPARINYRLAKAGTNSWLIREQLSEGSKWIEPLMCGVKKVTVVPMFNNDPVAPPNRTKPAQSSIETLTRASTPNDQQEPPSQWIINVEWSQKDRPAFEERIILR